MSFNFELLLFSFSFSFSSMLSNMSFMVEFLIVPSKELGVSFLLELLPFNYWCSRFAKLTTGLDSNGKVEIVFYSCVNFRFISLEGFILSEFYILIEPMSEGFVADARFGLVSKALLCKNEGPFCPVTVAAAAFFFSKAAARTGDWHSLFAESSIMFLTSIMWTLFESK